jgi:hypothetical protein
VVLLLKWEADEKRTANGDKKRAYGSVMAASYPSKAVGQETKNEGQPGPASKSRREESECSHSDEEDGLISGPAEIRRKIQSLLFEYDAAVGENKGLSEPKIFEKPSKPLASKASDTSHSEMKKAEPGASKAHAEAMKVAKAPDSKGKLLHQALLTM